MNERSRNGVRRARVALLLTAVATTMAGCATQRQFTIVTTPPDATIRVNGDDRGRGPLQATLGFASPQQAISVVASREGFEDANVPVTLATPQGLLRIDMKPRVRPITVTVEPAEAQVTLDGMPLGEGRASSLRYDLPFKLDERGRPATRALRAERAGFAAAELNVNFDDDRGQYALRLGPLRKDLLLATSPSGARLTLDRLDIGESPTALRAQPFAYDARTEAFIPRTLVATKPGYPPARLEIAWDDGKAEYVLPLPVYAKRVRLETDPPDAEVKLDGKPVPREADGSRAVALEFPPVTEAGKLREYALAASLERPGEQWKPGSATIGWDEGQSTYTITLEEILDRRVQARAIEYRAAAGKWSPVVVEATTLAYKDLTDGPLGAATRVTDLPAGTSIASFSVSPDGKLLAYSLVEPDAAGKPKSRLYMSRTDGVGGATSLTDGRQLDLTPAFDPGGDAILFSSDRGGGPMQVWSIPVDGQSGATRLTAGNADLLWPTLDTSPKPRVFYQALVRGQDEPKLYSTQVGTVFETDLVAGGGLQPRLSPRNDALAFVQFNGATKKTDIFKTGDRGGVVQKMTDSPDVSERDPAWSTDGTKIAFTAEVPFASGEGTQTDVYTVDASGGSLRAVTMNDALDDLPMWSPTGDAVYFRSNRGGKWDLWRIDAR